MLAQGVGPTSIPNKGFSGLSRSFAQNALLVLNMPNKLVWEYEGAEQMRHGEQCANVGDAVYDDVFEDAKAVRLDGAYIVIEGSKRMASACRSSAQRGTCTRWCSAHAR